MRILMSMFGWEESGGGTIFPRQVALELKKRGHEVLVIYAALPQVPGAPDYGLREHEEGGVRLVGVHNRPTHFLDEKAPMREVRDPEVVRIFEHYIETFRPDLVHYHNFLGLSLGIAEVAHRKGIPTFYTPYNFWLLCPTLYLNLPDLALCHGVNGTGSNCLSCTRSTEPGSDYLARRDRLREGYLRMVGPCLATSDCVRDLMLENGYPADRIRIEKLGNDRAQRLWTEVGRDRRPGVEGPLRIGFVGALLPIKGVHNLVAAAQHLTGAFEVVLHGDGPNDYVDVLKRIDTKGVVRFAGRFEDRDHGRLLAALHLGVVPSICYDHSPLVIGEFQAARVPVVGARIGGIPDYLQPGTGVLFEPNDLGALVGALQGLIDDPSPIVAWQSRLTPPLAFDAYVGTLETLYREARTSPPSIRSAPMKLNLGCGGDHLPGWLNIDKFPEAKPDQVMDLEQLPWPLPDNCADEVLLKHVLEHLGRDTDTFLGIMQELWRVTKPGGKVHIFVPHPRHNDFLGDPTHCRPVSPDLFLHFSREVNEDWQRRGLPGTPLAKYLGMDFAIESNTLYLDPYWLGELQSGRKKAEELDFAIRTYNNVVQQVEVVLRAVKPTTGMPAQVETVALAPDHLRVAWEGSWFVNHSLSKINRELGRRLLDHGVDLVPLPYEPNAFDPSKDPHWEALAARVGKADARGAKVHVRHQWPPRWDAPPSGKWVLIQPWEFGVIPRVWVGPLAQVDELWVPSAFVKRAYTLAGVDPSKVVVIPNGVDTARFRPEGPAYPLKTQKGCRFLFVGGTIHRKGIDVLLKAWRVAFTTADDVCLVIKGYPQGQVYTRSDAEEALNALQADPQAAEVEFLPLDLNEDEMAALYRACQAFVLPYRGEGFGMPLLEAMASGLPVITTGEGPGREFCTPDCAVFLPSERVAIPKVDQFDPATGTFWLEEPDLSALVAALRELAAAPAERARMGLAGRARALEAFRWDQMAEAVLARLRALAGGALPPSASTVFLHEATEGGPWGELLEGYLDAFHPGDSALFVLDLRRGVPVDLVQERLLAWARAQGAETFPDVALIQPGERPEDVIPPGAVPKVLSRASDRQAFMEGVPPSR